MDHKVAYATPKNIKFVKSDNQIQMEKYNSHFTKL